jgi:hypothetical protein
VRTATSRCTTHFKNMHALSSPWILGQNLNRQSDVHLNTPRQFLSSFTR